MTGKPEDICQVLDRLNLRYEMFQHPPAPNIAEAMKYWKDTKTGHCKNLFFRNHKGNKHYLVLVEHAYSLNIKDMEQRLRQGKITFASEQRLERYLGVLPGSVTPFGLIYDESNHVKLFIDVNLQKREMISFHPLVNTCSLLLRFSDFIHFLDYCGNEYEFTELY
jgi:Ala-tRNA(Pro) deacylase